MSLDVLTDEVDPDASIAVTEEESGAGTDWRRFAPVVAFVVVELFALQLWIRLGHSQWFRYDEWDFLAARKAGSIHDLLTPHNEHWSTIPILSYRTVFTLFGLHSYLLYQLPVILLHLTAAALLLVVMRRAAVNPWVAVAAASAFALFGSGWFNIVRAFQIGFTGSLVLGLVHLLLADHAGKVDRRDWLGLLAGLAGLMTSGVAVTMVIVVGVAVLVRRGWRVALLHTAPLAFVYVLWFYAYGRTNYSSSNLVIRDIPTFVTSGLQGTYQAIGQVGGVGLALAIVLAIGMPVAFMDRRRAGRAFELAAPFGLLVGSVVFLLITATGRDGLSHADTPRYLHLCAAMTLPALGVAIDAFVRRIRWFLPIGIALLVVGIPGNVRALSDAENASKRTNDATREMIFRLPRDELAQELPRSFVPEPRFESWVTLGWLLDAVHSGRLPGPIRASDDEIAADRLRLSFLREVARGPVSTCEDLRGNQEVALHRGEQMMLSGPVTITPSAHPRVLPAPQQLGAGYWMQVLRDTGQVVIRGIGRQPTISICKAPAAVAAEGSG